MTTEKMNIYIDSNIWLDLYHFSNNDLKEFNKLKTELVNLYLPCQTRDEVKRNRIKKISDARKKFEGITFSSNIPNLYKEFTVETAEFNRLNSELQNFFAEWKNKVSQAVIDKTLLADKVISDLFAIATEFPTDNCYDEAIKRMNIGNPPGKNNSYGDAINWESLLKNVPNGTDLYIVTDDNDYYDDKKNEIMNSFLLDEWKQKKQANIYAFKSLVGFFDKHLSVIKLKEEEARIRSIESLEQSESFHSTHEAISELTKYLDSFSDEEIERLIHAGYYNGQVSSILNDPDVKGFYCKLMNKDIHESIDYNTLIEFQKNRIMDRW